MVKKITILSVLEPFLEQPNEELHLAEISRQLKQPHPTTRQHLNELEKRGILIKTIKGRQTNYKLKLDNPLSIDYLTITEKNKLIEKIEKNLILREIHTLIKEKYSNNNTIIFGSTAEENKKNNDIDILITGKINRKDFSELSEKINKKTHIINTEKERVTKTLKEEIRKKHIIINKTEETLRWLYWE
ncbi:helix-turn-helix domain-containing protein [Candidatus Woesearchaeota archaeon]|nr:helix-turn-helix domain-containing protein [Candidatus Woesearchaeota archaeon]